MLGSPSYIPPEQACGNARDAGAPADVYALGAILYQMLTGRPPFQGPTPVETVMQVLHEDPQPPSRLQPSVPRDLETICLKCLAKEPVKRYATALALADDLDRFGADRPIHARRTPLWERGLKWARRRPVVTSLAGLSGLVTLVLSAVSLWFVAHQAALDDASRRNNELSLSSARNDVMRGQLDAAEKTLYRLTATIESQRRFADQQGRALELLAKTHDLRNDQRSRQAAQDRYRQFLDRRDAAFFQDTQFGGLESTGNSQAIRQSTLEALATFAAPGREELGWKLAPLPESLSLKQKEEVALGCYEMLLVLAEAVARPLPDESAMQQAKKALDILDRAVNLRREPTRAYHLRRAACLQRANDQSGAQRELAAANHVQPAGAFDHFLSGLERYNSGHLTEARRSFDLALQAQPSHFWAQCLLAICDLNARPARLAEAKAYLRSCLQSHAGLPWLYLLRGFASGQMGSASKLPDEAAGHFADAEADYRKVIDLDPEGKFRHALVANRGLLRFQNRRFEAAISDLKEAIALDPRQHTAHVTLAQVYRHQHKLEAALEELDRAIALKPDSAPLHRTRALWVLEQPDLCSTARQAALLDLDEAIRQGSAGSRELAKDLAMKGRILLLDKQYPQALAACDAALNVNPGDPDAHHWRVVALIELKRYADVIDSCDRYLKTGDFAIEILELRGLARAKRCDFAGAIEDYTLALTRRPDSAMLHARRGWAYLVSGAASLARLDFDAAIRLDPGCPEAYSGRGSAMVALGHAREAAADAEESLRLADSEPRLIYNAAHVMAQAAQCVLSDQGRGPVRIRDWHVATKTARSSCSIGRCEARRPKSEPRSVGTSFKPTLLLPGSAHCRTFPVWSRSTHHGRIDSTVSNWRTSSMFIPRIHDASPKTSPIAPGRRRSRQFVCNLERLEVRTPLSAGVGTSLATLDAAVAPALGQAATTVVGGPLSGPSTMAPPLWGPPARCTCKVTCPPVCRSLDLSAALRFPSVVMSFNPSQAGPQLVRIDQIGTGASFSPLRTPAWLAVLSTRPVL